MSHVAIRGSAEQRSLSTPKGQELRADTALTLTGVMVLVSVLLVYMGYHIHAWIKLRRAERQLRAIPDFIEDATRSTYVRMVDWAVIHKPAPVTNTTDQLASNALNPNLPNAVTGSVAFPDGDNIVHADNEVGIEDNVEATGYVVAPDAGGDLMEAVEAYDLEEAVDDQRNEPDVADVDETADAAEAIEATEDDGAAAEVEGATEIAFEGMEVAVDAVNAADAIEVEDTAIADDDATGDAKAVDLPEVADASEAPEPDNEIVADAQADDVIGEDENADQWVDDDGEWEEEEWDEWDAGEEGEDV